MNIELTADEYGILLDVLSLADFVLRGHKTDDDPRIARYEKVIQKLYGLGLEAGRTDKIIYDSELERFHPAKNWESSEPRKLLEEFADETFWHELTYRFTERDLERKMGGRENILLLSAEERFDFETSIEEKYLAEFEEHGIERLQIVEHFGVSGMLPRTSD